MTSIDDNKVSATAIVDANSVANVAARFAPDVDARADA
jgi:hypothetical protein